MRPSSRNAKGAPDQGDRSVHHLAERSPPRRGSRARGGTAVTPRTWLIVGHGSVGSSMAQRIDSAGDRVLVYDPAPRVAVTVGRRLERLGRDEGPVELVLSCGPPSAAAAVSTLTAPVVPSEALSLDYDI